MNILIKSMGVFLLMLVTMVAQAEVLQCVGMDGAGQTIHVIVDPESATININGDVHKPGAYLKGSAGFATEPFINSSGILVYNSVSPRPGGGMVIIQFNEVTEQPLSKVNLACHKE